MAKEKEKENLDHTNTNIQRSRISTPWTTCWVSSLLSIHLFATLITIISSSSRKQAQHFSSSSKSLFSRCLSLSSPAPQCKSSCSIHIGGGEYCLTTRKGMALKGQWKQLLTSCANILSLTLWYSSSLSSIDLLRLSSLNGRILFCWAEKKPGGLYKLSC